MPKFTTIFKIRIVYKSGYTHDFEVRDFQANRNGVYTWDAVSDKNKPLKLGVDDIAAIWQIGTRRQLTWS